ncbi:MAG: tyrosine-type recombinase/integrase, partial [Planctomycetes bacterium]|nr:tyrosine-type recombinase/integrase [Planctomycetota bacterium]
HTVSSYLRDLGMLRTWLDREGEPSDVETITPDQLFRFVTSPAGRLRPDGKPRQRSSVDKIKMSLRSFFSFLEAAGHIRQSPARLLKYRSGRHEPSETLSAREAEQLLHTVAKAKCDHAVRDHMMLDLFLETGLRLEALVGLDVVDVRLDDAMLVVRRMKGGNATVKYLSKPLMQRLAKYLRLRKRLETDSPALFLSRWNRRISTRRVQIATAEWARKAGIARKVTPHVLRHAFATRLYARTKDILLVKRAMDHRHVTTTEKYANVTACDGDAPCHGSYSQPSSKPGSRTRPLKYMWTRS